MNLILNIRLNITYLSCRKAKMFYIFFFNNFFKMYLFILYVYKVIILKSFYKNSYLFDFIAYKSVFLFFSINNLRLFFFKNNFNLKDKIYLYYNFMGFFKKFFKIFFYNFYDINVYLRDSKVLLKFLYFLKKDQLFYLDTFVDLLAIDNLSSNNRFLLFYNFLSVKNCSRLNILVHLKDFEKIYSVSCLYSSAFWLEREVWDLSGIYFLQHKDLRRILTDYGFQGHPLRRDFPLTGFFELYYNYSFKKIIYEPVSLAQKYRNFQFENKWK